MIMDARLSVGLRVRQMIMDARLSVGLRVRQIRRLFE
jgi:hypothetical protein